MHEADIYNHDFNGVDRGLTVLVRVRVNPKHSFPSVT